MMIVGVDIGTQSLKVIVASDDLVVHGQAATPYEPSFPKPGWVEQDPVLWLNALGPTIAKALANANCHREDIVALGIGGQLDGCIPVDAQGDALHPCLIWMDRRAEAEIEGLPMEAIRERTGVILDASHMAAKIRWLRGNISNASQIKRYHFPVSYVVQKLTGAVLMDHGLASTSMLYGLADKAFDPWLLEQFSIAANDLPAIAEASSSAGPLSNAGSALTGLPPGIPVSVGTGDDFTTPLGAGIAQPGRMACVLGTAEVVGALHDKPIIDTDGLLETHAYASDTFFIENPGWLSGGALVWLRDLLRLHDFAELDALAATAPPGCDGLTFIPALSGSMAPQWVASARGCFYGLTPAHGNAHMARAVLEGTAFAMRDVWQRLTSMDVDVGSIILLGGGAKSRIWTHIRADLTGLPCEVPTMSDTAPLGGVILAAVAADLYPDVLSASAQVGSISHSVEPNPHHKAAYDDAHGAYRKLFECLHPMF